MVVRVISMRASAALCAALALAGACAASPASALEKKPVAAATKKPGAKASLGKTTAKKTAVKVVAAKKPAAVEPPSPSSAAMEVANWAIGVGDNRGLPFMVIDKVAAQVAVYEADGSLRGVTPALLGLAHGDSSAPGVGSRKLSAIPPKDRTTPAGRFVAAYGYAAGEGKVLWVDYATAISIHPVITTNPKEHRLQRLKSPSVKDNRITFGCINVSGGFYETVVRRTFTGTRGVVYILPESEPLDAVFPIPRLRQANAEDQGAAAAAVAEESTPEGGDPSDGIIRIRSAEAVDAPVAATADRSTGPAGWASRAGADNAADHGAPISTHAEVTGWEASEPLNAAILPPKAQRDYPADPAEAGADPEDAEAANSSAVAVNLR